MDSHPFTASVVEAPAIVLVKKEAAIRPRINRHGEWFLGSFLADEGLDVSAFFDQLTGSDISLFAWADVLVCGLVVIALALRDRAWAVIAATLAVGPSLGLPLLLLRRERLSRT